MCSLPPVKYDKTGGKACTLCVMLSQTSEKGNLMSVCSLVVCTLRRVCSPTECPGGHGREVGRGDEEDPGGQGNCKAVGGGRGLKAKIGCDEKVGEGGERSGQVQWDAGTWTSVSPVSSLFRLR